ncbi:MAG: hypothetical protein PHW04_02420 [Candidatus Wallbacteria bacterium]|nr:hypothetical protein [Candidatus Wallbacteria bacterium]
MKPSVMILVFLCGSLIFAADIYSWTAPDGKLYVFSSREKLEEVKQKYEPVQKTESIIQNKVDLNDSEEPPLEPIITPIHQTEKVEKIEIQNPSQELIQQIPAAPKLPAGNAPGRIVRPVPESQESHPPFLLYASLCILAAAAIYYWRRQELAAEDESPGKIPVISIVEREIL